MWPLLLAPIFAQSITLGLGNRTEGRYLVQKDDKRWEGSTTPNAALSFGWRRSNLSFTYGPALRLSPIDRSPRVLTVFHTAGVQAGYRFRQTTLSLSSTLGYGSVNLQVAAVQAPIMGTVTDNPAAPTPGQGQQPTPTPPPTGGTPGSPTPNPPASGVQQPQVANRVVRYSTWTTTANVSHRLTREVTLSGSLGYTNTGGIGADAAPPYVRTQGWLASATATHRYVVSRANAFASNVTLSSLWSNNGNHVAVATATETWLHRYGPRTTSEVGAGLSTSRFSQFDGLVAISVFPTFSAAVLYRQPTPRGSFGANLRAFSAPAMDFARATVDPRVGTSGGLSWSRDRFSTDLVASASLSVARPGNDAGAVDSASGSFTMSYGALDYLSIDTGVRGNVQQFRDITVIPPTYVVFLGVNLGYVIKLTEQ